MSNSSTPDDINIRSARFLLARTLGPCARCRSQIPLFALGVPPGHLVLELDPEAEDDRHAVDTWRIAAASAFLFHVEFLTEAVQFRVRQFTRSYCRDLAQPDGAEWANHCEGCGATQDDQDLICEPDGAFFPISESSAGLIQLLPIDEVFEAIAAGYAPEPQFFGAMS